MRGRVSTAESTSVRLEYKRTAMLACGSTLHRRCATYWSSAILRKPSPLLLPLSATTAAAHGIIVPERFTHGSAAQHSKWFKIGIKTGNMRQCNTFAASNM